MASEPQSTLYLVPCTLLVHPASWFAFRCHCHMSHDSKKYIRCVYLFGYLIGSANYIIFVYTFATCGMYIMELRAFSLRQWRVKQKFCVAASMMSSGSIILVWSRIALMSGTDPPAHTSLQSWLLASSSRGHLVSICSLVSILTLQSLKFGVRYSVV